ncbi:UDP-glucose 6-dehydrogenase TuaD [bioreactor metagenome]|uniref:UDP-glucose 6-dehydrogenase TuaD n=1 Tax=bioreactor metagenome TaxID=1076179 RepID=A0A645GE57_9ZZZZ
MLGYHSQIIAAGRKINDNMAIFIADTLIKKMIQANKNVKEADIYIMGVTFKENCPDMRNSKAIEVCKHIAEYGIKVKVVDPVVDKAEFKSQFGTEPVDLKDVQNADCLVFLVAHQQFRDLRSTDLETMFKQQKQQNSHVIIDVKNIFDQEILEEKGYSYWSL